MNKIVTLLSYANIGEAGLTLPQLLVKPGLYSTVDGAFFRTTQILNSAGTYPDNEAVCGIQVAVSTPVAIVLVNVNAAGAIYSQDGNVLHQLTTFYKSLILEPGQVYFIRVKAATSTIAATENVAFIKSEGSTLNPVTTYSNGSMVPLIPSGPSVTSEVDINTGYLTISMIDYPMIAGQSLMLGWINSPAIANGQKIIEWTSTPILTGTRSVGLFVIGDWIDFILSPSATGLFTGTITCKLATLSGPSPIKSVLG